MIQIDMEIPKSCMTCPMLYDQMCCSITESKVDWSEYEKFRMSDCPLKEVKDNTATWEQIDNEADTFFTTHQYKCSNCGKIQLAKSKNIKNFRYCSKCGARMGR